MTTHLKKYLSTFALAIPFALHGPNAQADGYFCSSHLGRWALVTPCVLAREPLAQTA